MVENFNIGGKDMSKKIVLSGILAATLVMGFSCKTASVDKSQITADDSQTIITERWVDDNTLIVKGLGGANPDAKGFVRIKTQACEAAELAASSRFVKIMVGQVVAGASGSESGESTGVAVTSEWDGVMKGGVKLKENFSMEMKACEVFVKYQNPGLKKMAEVNASKKDFR